MKWYKFSNEDNWGLEQDWSLTPEGSWFHGGGSSISNDRLLFLTKNPSDAAWYAHSNGFVHHIDPGSIHPATYEEFEATVKELGLTPESVKDSSPYVGENFTDYVYVPQLQEALKAKGFDSVLTWDELTNYAIPTLVLLPGNNAKIIESRQDNSN